MIVKPQSTLQGVNHVLDVYSTAHGESLAMTICEPNTSAARSFSTSTTNQNIILMGTKPRYIRGIPVGQKEVWFALDVQRIECQDCQHLGQVRLGFADPQVSYSRGFERYALELLQMTTITDVAHHLKSETSKSASGKSISRMFAGWPLMKLLSKRGIAT